MDTGDFSYTADSVVHALKGNPALQFDVDGIDAIKCPFRTEKYASHPDIHPHDCIGDYNSCSLCKNRTCKQNLSVYLRNGTGFLIALHFNFSILADLQGGTYVTGFIRQNDSSLKVLIEHEYLKTEELIYAKTA